VATYEVCLRGAMPESLRERGAGLAVRAAPTETVLFRNVRDLGELDTLLERMRSMGLVLTEVHGAEPPDRRSAARRYEVRVHGELGAKLLGYLGWSHRLVTQRQVARGKVSARDLDAFLSQCTEAGLIVDQVRRTTT